MDMPTYTPKEFSRRATQHPAKIARPFNVGTNQFGGWRSASLRVHPAQSQQL
jgi:hypothetical protein